MAPQTIPQIPMIAVSSQEVDAHDFGRVRYQFNQQHRDSNPNKSQWEINQRDELNAFLRAANSNWRVGDNAWGLHIMIDTPHYLGRVPGNRRSFIAKFVIDSNHNAWHGYPADHILNAHDVPNQEVLLSWVRNKFIGTPKMRKIIRGQPCNI